MELAQAIALLQGVAVKAVVLVGFVAATTTVLMGMAWFTYRAQVRQHDAEIGDGL